VKEISNYFDAKTLFQAGRKFSLPVSKKTKFTVLE